MSRGAQTAWIVGSLLLIALVGLIIWARQPDQFDPDRNCYNIIGVEDQQCHVDHAVERMTGR